MAVPVLDDLERHAAERTKAGYKTTMTTVAELEWLISALRTAQEDAARCAELVEAATNWRRNVALADTATDARNRGRVPHSRRLANAVDALVAARIPTQETRE